LTDLYNNINQKLFAPASNWTRNAQLSIP